jgi:hypothetical protein
MKPVPAEAVIMTWAYHPDSGQRTQPRDCLDVAADVRSGQFVEQPAVVDGVTGKQDACLAVE